MDNRGQSTSGPVEFPPLSRTNQVAPALLLLETMQEESKRLAIILMGDGHPKSLMGKTILMCSLLACINAAQGRQIKSEEQPFTSSRYNS